MERAHRLILTIFAGFLFIINILSFSTTLNPKQLVNPYFVKNRTVSIVHLVHHIIFESGVRVVSRPKDEINDLVDKAAAKHGIDAELAKIVLDVESEYNQYAISRSGAMGLMQVMPATFREMSSGDPFLAEDNIDAGVRYLALQISRFDDLSLALSAYNAGPTVVARHNSVPSYPETQFYVQRILERYAIVKLSRLSEPVVQTEAPAQTE